MGLKLALCASLQDHLVGEEAIADYLLYWLNSHGKFEYVDYMGLKEPCDDINRVSFIFLIIFCSLILLLPSAGDRSLARAMLFYFFGGVCPSQHSSSTSKSRIQDGVNVLK